MNIVRGLVGGIAAFAAGMLGAANVVVTDPQVLARGGDAVYRVSGAEGTEYIHVFTGTTGTRTFTNNSGKNLSIRYLAVGGGGSGGYGCYQSFGGGGGAGGDVVGSVALMYRGTTWDITVGAGGVAATSSGKAGGSGGTSQIVSGDRIIANAGGGGFGAGASKSSVTYAVNGGGGAAYPAGTSSGNGAPRNNVSGVDDIVYSGFSGASAACADLTSAYPGILCLSGGGAGAGGNGGAGDPINYQCGNGGPGIFSDISGEEKEYGAGGGGGGGVEYADKGTVWVDYAFAITNTLGLSRGLLPGEGANGGGVGGYGMRYGPSWNRIAAATAGADGFGCGGGGGTAGATVNGANGGSGVVILRYFEREAGEKAEPEPAPEHVASSRALEDFMCPCRSDKEPLVITLDPTFVKFDKNDGANGFNSVYSNQIQNAVRSGRPVNVVFRNGTYCMPIYKNWDFFAGLSGTPEAPVTFKAETPGMVRFYGTAPVAKNGFAKITSTDRWYSRIPSAARSKVVAANISSSKIHIPVDTTKNCGENAPSTQVYLDGRFQECARWPNRMANGCAGWTNYVSCVNNSNVNAVKIRLPFSCTGRWSALTSVTNGVFFHGSFVEPWTDEFIRVSKLENGTDITFATKMQAMPKVGTDNQIKRFAVVNAVEEIDTPGEWWLDKINKRLYYYPEESDFLTSSSELYLVSNQDMLIDFQGAVHDVRFEGIEFAYSGNICAVGTYSAKRIEFDNCYFHSFHKDAVIQGTEVAFRRCRFEHFGGGVVQFRRSNDSTYTERRTLTSTRNLFEDCEFSDFQHVKVSGTRAIQAYLTGSAVRNCSFDGGGHSAIIFRGNDIFMGWNRSRNCLRETIDASVFYTGRDSTYLGNIILGCDFRDSKPLEGSYIKPESDDKRACALYLDDGVWGGDFIGNSVDNVRQGLWLRGGNMHTFAWNRFTNCGLGMKLDATCAPERSEFDAFLDGATRATWHMAYVTKYGIDLDNPRWRAEYPTYKATLTREDRFYPWNNLVLGNVLMDCGRFLDGTADGYSPKMTFSGNYVIGSDGVFAGHEGFSRLDESVAPTEVPGMGEAMARIAALSNAVPAEAYSPNGHCRVRFLPDATARLCVRVDIDGRDFLYPSETGLTVGDVDYGRLTYPVNAVTQFAGDGGEYTLLTFDLVRVLDGSTAASVEAQVYDNGVRYRYRVRTSAVAFSEPSFTNWRVAEGVTAVTEGELDETVSYSSGTVIGAWRTVSTSGTLAPEFNPVTDGFKTNALDYAWGYEIQGLGKGGQSVALVFTNTTETMHWTIPTNVAEVEYLVVAGGASGGHAANANGAGGGGAGAVKSGSRSVSQGTVLTIDVGAGGASVSAPSGGSANGRSGGSSTLKIGAALYTCTGGGGGGAAGAGQLGGCGGGAGCTQADSGSLAGGQGSKNGGNGGNAAALVTYRGAGGGGAGEDGGDWNDDFGRGGDGAWSDITGVDLPYAGGGGGSGTSSIGFGIGGEGGGGSGSRYSTKEIATTPLREATDGSMFGAGGGGASYSKSKRSGAGYQGVVVVRYTRTNASCVPGAVNVPAIGSTDGAAFELADDAVGISITNADPRFRYGYRMSPTLEGLKTATTVFPATQPSTPGAWTLDVVRNPSSPASFYQLIAVPW